MKYSLKDVCYLVEANSFEKSILFEKFHLKNENPIEWKDGIVAPDQGWQAIEKLGTTDTLGYYLPHGPDWVTNATEELGYDMADCWASCMIPFDWGLQYDPRGYIYISEMVSGIYVVQYDGDKHPDYDYPPLYET